MTEQTGGNAYMEHSCRIVFMGTPEFAVGSLRALVEGGFNVVAVVTQPDRAVGRHGSVLQPSEVKRYAMEHQLPVLQPEKMRDPAFLEQLKAFDADLQVVVAFRMLPEVVWAMPRYGTFNVHASLLPQYRGAAPINWAVINGETQTGVTTFFLDHEIDTGRIIDQKTFDIPDDANVEYVYDGLMELGAQLCVETVEKIIRSDGQLSTVPQRVEEGKMLHEAPKIFKDTCRIDWHLTAKRVYDFIRGLSPYPGTWTTCGGDAVMKIYRATKTGTPCVGAEPGTVSVRHQALWVATADEWLQVEELQLAGKKRMQARDFLNGMKNASLFTALI